MLATILSLFLLVAGAAEQRAWTQWGGPDRNFVVDARELATRWPEVGPTRKWQRPLGDGYSAIVTDGRTLYTLYREGATDVAIALDAETGRTVWQTPYEAPFVETCSERLGAVPRAAPLLFRDRLVTVSAGGRMNAFDAGTGRRLWTLDLLEGSPASVRACGYAASPVAFDDLIIATPGGKGRGVVAVRAASGEIVWRAHDFENGYSSPLLIDLDGQPEVVAFTYGEVSGLDPRTGALEWTHPHAADQGVNVATPVWGAGNLLFVSSAYNGGSRVLRLARRDGKVDVEEVWANRRVRIHFGNVVRLGDAVYGSNGDFGAAPFAAVDIRTGDVLWRDRSMARSTVVATGDRLLLLDEDGVLALATPTAAGLTVHAKASILPGRTWTVPTLSGTTLFIRNTREIVALDLTQPAVP
jgi:outer membrane protein assembly factor BamB